MSKLIALTQIELSSGETIDVAPGVTAIVGPNNTGKSSLLRELREQLTTEPHAWQMRSHKVVDHPVLAFNGSAEDQLAELEKHYTRRPPGQYNDGRFNEDTFRLINGAVVTPGQVAQYWQTGLGLGAFGSYFVTYLDAESRLQLTNSSGSYDLLRELPGNSLQVLFSNRDIEKQVADLAEAAFKTRVVVNRHSGSAIHLHAGRMKAPEPQSPPPREYLEELAALALVQAQGDGMKAFVGMLVSVLTGQSPLILIDEPEAFLHPPQARMFGRFLAEYGSAKNDVQVIVATHSEDVIAGLTSVASSSGRVSIARITRHGNTNHVAQLTADAVSDLYSDPLMKHYDMLNGLFSTGVVLCEADSDCTYFRAVLDVSKKAVLGSVKEAHFTHAGGKARISRAIGAFAATAVPTAAIFDIDILQNDGEFWALIEAIGADKAIIEPLRNTVVSAVNARSKELDRTAVQAKIATVLGASGAKTLSKADVKQLREAVTPKSGWGELKLSGSALLSGGVLGAYNKLSKLLETKGVFIVSQGELERLHPAVPQTNKAEWLRQVIDTGVYKSSPAMPMLERISKYLTASQTKVAVVVEAEGKERQDG